MRLPPFHIDLHHGHAPVKPVFSSKLIPGDGVDAFGSEKLPEGRLRQGIAYVKPIQRYSHIETFTMIGQSRLKAGDIRKTVQSHILQQTLVCFSARLEGVNMPSCADVSTGNDDVHANIRTDIDKYIPRPHEVFQETPLRQFIISAKYKLRQKTTRIQPHPGPLLNGDIHLPFAGLRPPPRQPCESDKSHPPPL